MTDIGHAGTDKHFIDFVSGTSDSRLDHPGHSGTQQRFFDFVHIDFDDFRVFRIGIGFQQHRIRQPRFHVFDAALNGATSP